MPDFEKTPLIPAIVQHARSGEVLMLGYMNEEALQKTKESKRVTFWSRSRSKLWTKGETSGHWLHLVDIRQDCDGDTLLVLAEPEGPTCHTGRPVCFHQDIEGHVVGGRQPGSIILTQLADTIHQRHIEQTQNSYTAELLRGGVDRIGKKVAEEAAEVIIAAKNNSPSELTYEVADLVYHTLVLLENQGVSLEAVWEELQCRANKSA